jgi:hypothetical protein
MATTTNYGWTTPDDTALVKDGAAAIRTLGSSVDTTTKALNPSTTLGDIEYRSSTANTNTRLAIGSTGDVLTVAGGVPSWAAPAPTASGLNLITTQSFSASSSVVVNNCFTSTYTNYKIILNYNSSANAQTRFRLRVGGTSDSANSYSANSVFINNTTVVNEHNGALTYFVFNFCDATSTPTAFTNLEVGSPNESKETAFYTTGEMSKGGATNSAPFIGAGIFEVTTVFDGFEIFPGSGNITGTVQVYGYGK